MQKNAQDKFLIDVNKNGIFNKIKKILKKLFSRDISAVMIEKCNTSMDEGKRDLFREKIKRVEDEYTSLLKLQKKYRDGEITEKDLTDEQIESLCSLYDKQIADLKKSNEIRKKNC